MKKLLFSFVILTVLAASPTLQAQNGIALGGELISPVGISYKFDVTGNSAITGAFGVLLSDGANSATFEVNYLSFQDPGNVNIRSGDLSPYFGLGLALRSSSNSDETLSVRIPVGMEYRIDDSPFEIYMDIGPYITVTDPLLFTFDSSLGFRYRFN